MTALHQPGLIEPETPSLRGCVAPDHFEPFTKVVETHTAVVFFMGARAYKIKKPVSFGFVDFSRSEARRRACHREVELNSRLSPDVYLGVADVIAPDGAGCEHVVMMQRLPEERRLSSLARSVSPVRDHLELLATMLARFHARADRSAVIDAAATRDSVTARWETNSREMVPFIGSCFSPDTADQVMTLAHRYLAGREDLFQARIEAGRVCDGHGDLLADDIFCLDDGPRVLDCLEFDDQLRYGDVLADIAFLGMDLEHLGRPDLSRGFLGRYRELTGDQWPASLEHHYLAYRAQVRALVTALRSRQGDAEAAWDARHLLDLAVGHLQAGRVRLVVIGGLPGTGKSSLAARVARSMDAQWIRSDVIRKRLAGMDPLSPAPAPFGDGIYTAEMTGSTYSEMMRQAHGLLTSGQNVVLDATFVDPAWRETARDLAVKTMADLDELHCVAPLAVLEDRLVRRAARGDASDASGDVARELHLQEVPWPSAEVVETTEPLHTVHRYVLDYLGATGTSPDGAAR